MNWVSELFGAAQLERVENAVTRIVLTLERLEQKMSQQEAQLDEALGTLGAKLTALSDAVNALIAAIPPGVELGDELATVEAALGEVDTITSAVVGATPSGEPAGGGTTGG